MQLNVKLVQKDLSDGTETVIADGRAILSGDTLSYCESDNPSGRHHVTFRDEKIVLKRTADISSVTTLVPHASSTAVVHSPYGDMVLDTMLEKWSKNDDAWMVEYRIMSNGETLTHQRLTWEMRGAGNERD